MPTWPETLPVSPDSDGYGEEGPFAVIQAPVDGPPLSRRRYTAAIHPVNARYMLSDAELAIFEDFWRDDLKDGALEFDGPTRGKADVVSTYRAISAYKLAVASCGHWFVTLTLIRLP